MAFIAVMGHGVVGSGVEDLLKDLTLIIWGRMEE